MPIPHMRGITLKEQTTMQLLLPDTTLGCNDCFVILEVLQAASVTIEAFAAVCGASYAAARTVYAPAAC